MPHRLAFAAAVMLLLAVFAFWPQYLSRLSQADGYTHVHAVLGTCWLLILVGQPLLVRARKFRLHRVFGRIALIVATAFFANGILVAHRSIVRMPAEDLDSAGYFLYLPLSMTLIFGAAVLLGVIWRKVPAIHGRFMASSALPLLDPLFARILYFHFPPLPAEFLYQVPAFSLAIAVLVAMATTLPRPAPGRTAFRIFSLCTAAVLLVYFAIPHSEAWLDFVKWFRALPVT